MAYIKKHFDRDKKPYYRAAWLADDGTGKKKTYYERYTGPDGKRGAQKLADLREAQSADPASQPKTNQKIAFDKYLMQMWLPRSVGGLTYKSRYGREQTAQNLAAIIGPKPLFSITAFDFGTLKIELEKRRLAPSTIIVYFKLMKRALRDAHSWGLIASRPWDDVRPVKRQKSPPRVVTRAEGLQAADYLRGKGDDYTADLVTLLTFTGVRLSEALGLHFEDIDQFGGTISIWRVTAPTEGPERAVIRNSTKSPAGTRTLPINATLLEMLVRRQSATDNPLVFPTKKGKPAHSADVTAKISAALKAIGLVGKTAHGLRHGALTRLMEKNVPLHYVSKLAGHTSTQITAEIYLAYAKKEDAIAAMRQVIDD